MTSTSRRSIEELREQYELEKELANRIRSASREERLGLYRTAYDELFRRIPHHNQLRKKQDAQTHYRWVLDLLRPYLGPGKTFLELGAGDCQLAVEVARTVSHVYAVDVSAEIVRGVTLPANVELLLSDGCSIPVPDGSVDVVLSNQLIEHIHPDDVSIQLEESHRALRPGGRFVCVTPHRFSGPHDISKYFDDVATGFHLHEYTSSELAEAFRLAGFRRMTQLIGGRGRFLKVSLRLVSPLEATVSRLPTRFRRRLCARRGFASLFERLILVAEK